MKYIKKLEQLNASVWVLTQKIKNIHFNLKGKEFMSLHLLTDKLYAEMEEHYDLLSEKIAMASKVVKAGVKEHLDNSLVKDAKGKTWKYDEGIKTLVKDLDTILKLTKELTNEDIYTLQPAIDEVTMTADKYRWLFKSHVE